MPVNTRVKLASTTEKQVLKDLAGFAAGLQRLHTITVQKWCLGYVLPSITITNYPLSITNYQLSNPPSRRIRLANIRDVLYNPPKYG